VGYIYTIGMLPVRIIDLTDEKVLFSGAYQVCRSILCPHPQPLSQAWERGARLPVPLLPYLGEGVRG
jgi:hypothetical protein